MKRVLAAWREFQDTVVRHPLCRYTILPACIILAIWLVALAMAANVWHWQGWDAYCFSDGIMDWNCKCFWWSVMAIVGVTGMLLTGRWLPVLVGLVAIDFAVATYMQTDDFSDRSRAIYTAIGGYQAGHSDGNNLLLWSRLAIFIPALLWLLIRDRKPDRWPALSGWLKFVAGMAAAFCLGLVVAWGKADSQWIKAGFLQSLSAAFWFTVLFDLSRRVSHDRFGRIIRGLILGGLLGLVGFRLYDAMVSWDHKSHWLECAIGLLVLFNGQLLSHLITDRDAKGETP